MTRESDILRAVHGALGSRPDVRLWRVQVAVAVPLSQACPRCRPRAIKFGIPGQADLQGLIMPTGRYLSVEVKSETGRLSPEQIAWDAMVRRFGGVSLCPVRSVEEAEEMLGEALNG